MNSIRFLSRQSMRILLALAFLVPSLAGITSTAFASGASGPAAVYTLTNANSGNEVLVYNRGTDGTLSFQGSFATGGLGSGAGLGSQGSLVFSKNNEWLFAVNAGSNQISVFLVRPDGLKLVDVVASGGEQPISLTNHGKSLYVLNAGGSGNITGFSIASNGKLSPMAGSTQPLSNLGVGAAPGPAEIAYSPDGRTLVVTEKASNLIDTYPVENGLAQQPATHPSSGLTPFGFAFNTTGTLVVSEAFGGAPGQSATSSYQVDGGSLEVISPSVGTTQTSACWVAISKNGRFAYTTNAASGTISSYGIAADGSLTLLNGVAGSTGAGSSPIDMAFSNNGAYLYALGSASHTISIFQENADGSLTAIGNISVPDGVAGLAAR